jgi:acetyl-CoA carboxylase, biotin carboxylase subunit
VPPHYDSLLAKLIVHGNTREEVLARARGALDTFVVQGIHTTLPLLSAIVRDEGFIRGDVDTRYVERFLSDPNALS